jgi:hypothetical protein
MEMKAIPYSRAEMLVLLLLAFLNGRTITLETDY